MRRQYVISNFNSKPAASGALAAALLCSASSQVLAQVPSAAPIQLPAVEVVAPKKKTVTPVTEAKPAEKAPAASQQTSRPRAPSASEQQAETASSAGQPGPAVREAPAAASTVVAPTGIPTSVDQTGASVTVITSGQIEAEQRRTAPEILKSVPGIAVVQTGGPGGTTSIFTRGTGSNHTKVLIDGVDVSDPSTTNRAFDTGSLLAMDIDRVELLRGPQSGLYGADALGGVIVVYTKQGEKGPPVVEGLVEAGSFGTFNQAVGARGGAGAFTYSFNAQHLKVDDTPVTPDYLIPSGIKAKNYAYENWTYSGRVGVEVSEDLKLNFVGRYSQGEYRYANSLSDKVLSNQDYDQYSGRAEAVLRSFGGGVMSYFGVNYANAHRDYATPYGPSTYDGDNVKIDWRSVVNVAKGTTVTVGADHAREAMESTSTYGNMANVSNANTGVYTQVQVEPIHNLFLTGNVRYDDNDSFGDATTWRFSPVYIVGETGTKVKANIGTAFKAPSLYQLYAAYYGNANLKPEESTGMDVGFEQPVAGGRAQFGATYFYNDINNMIGYNYLTYQYINIDSAKTRGVEAFAAADLSDALRVRLDYTYTDVQSDNISALLRRPHDKVGLTVGYRPFQPLLLTGNIQYIGTTLDIDRKTYKYVDMPDYTLVNVAAEYEINKNVTAFGRIDNLFDKRYQSPNGYEAQGIGAYAGLRLRN